MRPVVLALACVSLAGCGGSEGKPANDTAAADFVPPATQAPTPLPGQAHTRPLAAYVGHYPDEPVDGVDFFDRTEVATALDGAVTDAALRSAIVRNGGPRTPVFQVGNRIASWGCEAHDCAAHNWTVLIDPATGRGEVCVHEGGRTLWRAGGPPEARPGDCPSEKPVGQAG
jgi:hypothetical protein